MANTLADAIRTLTLEKINFADDAAESVIDSLVSSALTLDDAKGTHSRRLPVTT